jgi:hypothetical protein
VRHSHFRFTLAPSRSGCALVYLLKDFVRDATVTARQRLLVKRLTANSHRAPLRDAAMVGAVIALFGASWDADATKAVARHRAS